LVQNKQSLTKTLVTTQIINRSSVLKSRKERLLEESEKPISEEKEDEKT
jgi:hypothetical protein